MPHTGDFKGYSYGCSKVEAKKEKRVRMYGGVRCRHRLTLSEYLFPSNPTIPLWSCVRKGYGELTKVPTFYVLLVPTIIWSHSMMTVITCPCIPAHPSVWQPIGFLEGYLESRCVSHTLAGGLGPQAVHEVLVEQEANWGQQQPRQNSMA